MNRKYLIAGLLSAACSPLLAQVAPPPAAPTPPIAPAPPAPPVPGAHMGAHMAMNNRVVTRAEVDAKVRTHFARIDANRDGFITTEEAAAMGGAHRVMVHGMPGQAMGAGGPAAAFDRLDSNRDGSISRDEFAKGRQVRIEKRVIVNNAGPGGVRQMRMKAGGMGGGPMMVRMADSNKDGRVSLAEATGAALQHFDRMDSNRDGRLTPDERRAGGATVIRMRRPG